MDKTPDPNDTSPDRFKPMFANGTLSFDVIDRTDKTAVLEFWFESESEEFFSGLREAGYQGKNGRLRLLMPNNFETGTPVHIEIAGFGNVEWSPTNDCSDEVVLDGTL